MTFRGKKFTRNDKTCFNYAWKHPIISGMLVIKYSYKWMMHLGYSYFSPGIIHFEPFFLSLHIRASLWIYIGTMIGVIADKLDASSLLTEIPFAIIGGFLLIFGLSLMIRTVISFLERIKMFKEDNLFLYGLGVAIIYMAILSVFLGQAFD